MSIERDAERQDAAGDEDEERFQGIVPVTIRWFAGKHDLADVLRIEQESFGNPWVEEDVRLFLRDKGIGLVAEHNERILGYIFYHIKKTRLHIGNMVVAPEARRQRIGTQIIARMKDKLSTERWRELRVPVAEANLATQLFLSEQGFLATSVRRSYYDDDQDAFVMSYDVASMEMPEQHFAIISAGQIAVPRTAFLRRLAEEKHAKTSF